MRLDKMFLSSSDEPAATTTTIAPHEGFEWKEAEHELPLCARSLSRVYTWRGVWDWLSVGRSATNSAAGCLETVKS